MSASSISSLPNSSPVTIDLRKVGLISEKTIADFLQNGGTLVLSAGSIHVPARFSLEDKQHILDLSQFIKYTTGPSYLHRQRAAQEQTLKTFIEEASHPHLSKMLSHELDALSDNTTLLNISKLETKFDELQKKGILDKDGNIDFKALAKQYNLPSKVVNHAHMQGKIWIDENKQFQMNITCYCGPEAAQLMETLQKALDIPYCANCIDIDPQVLNPSPEELNTLEHGGQIQFRFNGNKVAKLALDPHEGNLSINVFQKNDHGTKQASKLSEKIPLKCVFEGIEYNGYKALQDDHPILGDWQKRKLFEQAITKTEYVRPIWFTSRFDRITSCNSNEANQASAEIWAAVDTYLGLRPQAQQPSAEKESPLQNIPPESPVEEQAPQKNASSSEGLPRAAMMHYSTKPRSFEPISDAARNLAKAIEDLKNNLRSPLQINDPAIITEFAEVKGSDNSTLKAQLKKSVEQLKEAQKIIQATKNSPTNHQNTEALLDAARKLDQAMKTLTNALNLGSSKSILDAAGELAKAIEDLKNNLGSPLQTNSTLDSAIIKFAEVLEDLDDSTLKAQLTKPVEQLKEAQKIIQATKNSPTNYQNTEALLDAARKLDQAMKTLTNALDLGFFDNIFNATKAINEALSILLKTDTPDTTTTQISPKTVDAIYDTFVKFWNENKDKEMPFELRRLFFEITTLRNSSFNDVNNEKIIEAISNFVKTLGSLITNPTTTNSTAANPQPKSLALSFAKNLESIQNLPANIQSEINDLKHKLEGM